MIKSITQTITAIGGKGGVTVQTPTVPLAVFTRFADEVARIARTTEMSPTARQQLCEELEACYTLITSKQSTSAILYA